LTDLIVESLWTQYIIIDHLDIEASSRCSRQVFYQFPKLRPTYTVGAVNGHTRVRLSISHGLLESGCGLLIVPLLSGFSIVKRRSFGVETASDVVKLRRSKDFIISIVRLSSSQGLNQSGHKPRTGSTSIPSEDNARLDIWFDAEVPDEPPVYLDQCFIRWSVS